MEENLKMWMTGSVSVEVVAADGKFSWSFKNAYAATFGSKTGTVLLAYSCEDSKLLYERVYTTPSIADEMREFLANTSPLLEGQFVLPFGRLTLAPMTMIECESKGVNPLMVDEAEREATVLVYDTPS
jgi:hypothetical protein